MTLAFVGIGSNLGDRVENVRHAVERLGALEGVDVLAVSPVYESTPWGVEDQPPFANAVARIDARIEARPLLEAMQGIETDLGRIRGERYGPRVIDLDLLLFGDEEWEAPDLRIPHPLMLERDFVVKPLRDVAQGARLPGGEEIPFEGPHVGEVLRVLAPSPWSAPEGGAAPHEGPDPLTGAVVGDIPTDEEVDADEWNEVLGEGFAGAVGPPIREIVADPDNVIDDWIAIGPATADTVGIDAGGADLALLWLEAVLTDAGIDVRFHPHRPDEGAFSAWSPPGFVRLYVEKRRLDDARRALADAIGAGSGSD